MKKSVFMLFCVLVAVRSFSQFGGNGNTPGSGGSGGTIPSGPGIGPSPSVPFDGGLSLLLLASGIGYIGRKRVI